MATTFMDKQKTFLVKKFHVLLGKAGLDALAKEGLLGGYHVESSKDLTVSQLVEVCDILDKMINPQLVDLDKWRKRLMAAIGGWLKAMGQKENISMIKAVACRASQRNSFNDIPLEKLRSLYAAFNKKQKDLSTVETMTADVVDVLSRLN